MKYILYRYFRIKTKDDVIFTGNGGSQKMTKDDEGAKNADLEMTSFVDGPIYIFADHMASLRFVLTF